MKGFIMKHIKNNRSKQYRLRLTEEEYRLLKQKAESSGITMSEYIRRCIFNKLENN